MLKWMRWIGMLLLGLLVVSLGAALTAAQTSPVEELQIAFVSNRQGNEDIFIMSVNGEGERAGRLTDSAARDWDPAWSPDGAQIIFNSDRDGRDTLYIMNADGRDERPLFSGETFNDYEASFSPDGSQIVFVSDRGGIGRDIYTANVDGTNIQPITTDGRIKGTPTFSPDGLEILFWDQTNDGSINVYRYTIADGEILLVTDGQTSGSPVWSPLGDAIFFDSDRGDGFWAVYRAAPDGASPERMTDSGVNSGRSTISPDGQQIAFVTDRDQSDDIYRVNIDGRGLTRLTINDASDHSPAWQPAIPPNVVEIAVLPTPIPASDALGPPTVGQSASGVETVPITLERLKLEYGIQAWHDNNWLGAGQRVGVIDTAFGGLDTFMETTGDVLLPPDVLLSDYSNSNDAHGTEVLEIIHTIVPNADLYACQYKASLEELTVCRDWMVRNGVKVINHSVGLPILPLNGKSAWANLVNDTYAQSVLWVNSAGNFNQGYYTDNFQDGDDPDSAHDFIVGNQLGDMSVDLQGQRYSGNVLLSWIEPTEITNEFGEIVSVLDPMQRIDLDLEIVDAAGNPVGPQGAGQQRQTENLDVPTFERIQLAEVATPFSIRVVNAGRDFEERVEFSIFVEFAPLELRADKGSTIAPADAVRSLTVGAVNGNRQLGAYSSRGLEIGAYTKPDLSAPGEIVLANGTPFIGTSAAAPVISGVAALLLERNADWTIDELYEALAERYVVNQNNLEFGAGILQLGPPGISRQNGQVLIIPPKTVFPQPEEIFVDEGYQCPGAIPPRMKLDMPGYVNYDLGLAIRQQPGGSELDRLNLGQLFTVIGGPVCLSQLNWWEVELDTGAIGWVGEGEDYYLIAPVVLESAELPQEYDPTCPNALETQLTIGGRGRTSTGGTLFFFRSEGARNQMDPVGGGELVHILGGPLCEGRNNDVLRWYVRIVEGNRLGQEGWLAEGDTDTRTIDPVVEQE
ncbi:MAG: S8 family serine peptidase [Anaerolineae bacterium]|nr:S8 family serine peptidase [Anaerolineae bacterium]